MKIKQKAIIREFYKKNNSFLAILLDILFFYKINKQLIIRNFIFYIFIIIINDKKYI